MPPTQSRSCPACGTLGAPSASFCGRCGAALVVAPAPPRLPAARTGRLKKVALGCVLVVVVPMVILFVIAVIRYATITKGERAAEEKEQAAVRKQAEERRAAEEKERAAVRKQAEERQAAEKKQVADAFIGKLRLIARRLPAPGLLAEKKCPARLHDVAIKYVPADYGLFAKLSTGPLGVTDGDASSRWFRARSFDDAAAALSDPSPEKGAAAVARAANELGAFSTVAVFYPLVSRLPGKKNGSTFEPGYFDGWVVLVDAVTAEPLCQSRFRARSSDKVEAHRVKVGIVVPIIPIGKSIDTAIWEDYTGNFWASANAAIMGMQ